MTTCLSTWVSHIKENWFRVSKTKLWVSKIKQNNNKRSRPSYQENCRLCKCWFALCQCTEKTYHLSFKSEDPERICTPMLSGQHLYYLRIEMLWIYSEDHSQESDWSEYLLMVCGKRVPHFKKMINMLMFFCLSVSSYACSSNILTLVLLNLDMPCLYKQCRSRSVGFWRSQLIWICSLWLNM